MRRNVRWNRFKKLKGKLIGFKAFQTRTLRNNNNSKILLNRVDLTFLKLKN